MLLFLKGILIGIGKMIPGVSGGLIAINLQVYEKGVYSLTHLNQKESLFFLINIGSGILLAMIMVSRFLFSFFTIHYVITMAFFIGLLSGGIRMKDFSFVKKNPFLFLFSFILLVSFAFFPQVHNQSHHSIFFFFVGFLEAATIIIPGISGTAILMILGCYTDIIEAIGHLTNLNYLSILLPFSMGLSIGGVLLIKLIESLIERHKEKSEGIIFAFSLASICLLIKPFFHIRVSIILFVIFFFIGFFLSHIFQKLTS